MLLRWFIIHGVPPERAIQHGDLVRLDVTAEKDGCKVNAGTRLFQQLDVARMMIEIDK